MTTVVVGGGIAGLTAAYKVAESGERVVVLERDGWLGGLASSFPFEDASIERYYHFICKPDEPYFRLLEELGLMDRLVWHPTRMGYFFEGKYFRFGTPAALLAFRPLSFASRVRFGLSALRSKRTSDWRELDSVSARDWLVREQGAQAYEVVWKPLLELKFGDRADEVSAAWMWARINRVANSRQGLLMREYLGHLEGGTQTLVDELVRRIEASGGTVRTSARVDEIIVTEGRVSAVRMGDERIDADRVISTVAPPLLLRMTSGLPTGYATLLGQIEYYGVACWLLVARQALSDDFWLNVHDADIPFPGVITYTNLRSMPELGGRHLLYVPLYMSTSDPRWESSKDDGLARLLAALDRIRPGFSRSVEASYLFKDEYAQPVFHTDFRKRFGTLEDPRTPVHGLFRVDMSQIYPDDRSLVNAIEKGFQAAEAACTLER